MKNETETENLDIQTIIAGIAEIKSITQRIEQSTDGINYRLDNLENEVKNVKKSAIVTGGLAGGVVAVGLELLRIKLGL